uniref:Matrix metallopeptidase 20b (enamelysin) n=1 Tax=Nothobranchius furzeri TaxID=105023 RepID=A0A8C6KUL9_NOTFU
FNLHIMLLPFCVLVFLRLDPSLTAPAFSPEEELGLEYLHRFYKLQKDPSGRMRRSGPSFTSKVKDMQTFFGLNSTGELDSGTLEVMRSPRCGVPDVEEYSHIHGTRWNKNVIAYSIGRYTRDLPSSTVDFLIESAFGVWAKASGLTFVRSHTHNTDIMVEFVTYAHGDFYPFDGPRGTLAHAFGPGSGAGGDTHFDDDEHWTAGGAAGFNLFVVAAHEFGHALGLKHSRNPESLMYPTYKISRTSNLLSREDVHSINALYSKQLYSKQLYSKQLYEHLYLWMKHKELSDIKEGPITNFLPKIETGIDAAFWIPRRSTAYLIHESTFWTIKRSVIKGKPRTLSYFGFPPWVQDVDATVHIEKTGRTLFFLQDTYWSYNENRKIMDFGYPKYISEDFPGINSTINAAFYKNSFIYFFMGPQVLKFDYTLKQVVGVEMANSWLGC